MFLISNKRKNNRMRKGVILIEKEDGFIVGIFLLVN